MFEKEISKNFYGKKKRRLVVIRRLIDLPVIRGDANARRALA